MGMVPTISSYFLKMENNIRGKKRFKYKQRSILQRQTVWEALKNAPYSKVLLKPLQI